VKTFWICTLAMVAAVSLASAQSPAATASVNIGGKTISIHYSAPSVRGRVGKIFGEGGLISNDRTYPAWRGGANSATALHTDAELDIGGLKVPPGDYTLFIGVKDPNAWELIVNKQTGQSGLEYDAKQDLGRVKMTMSKPKALVEQLTYTLTNAGGNKVKLQLAWENKEGSVTATVK
jgi:hypothetical protein